VLLAGCYPGWDSRFINASYKELLCSEREILYFTSLNNLDCFDLTPARTRGWSCTYSRLYFLWWTGMH